MTRWVLCLAAFLVLLGGCGPEAGAERAVERLLSALQDGKLERAEDCAADGTLSFDGRTGRAKDFYRAIFSTLGYSITGTAVEGESAAVNLTVTAVNMDLLVLAETSRLLDSALSGEERDSEDFYRELTGIIESGAVEYITLAVTARAVETDGGWKVDLAASPALADAITGGMGELIL